MDYFLPVFRKLVFPIAMPFCFRFPPMVAGTVSPMRPMVDSVLSAFCNHRMAVKRACAREAALSFSTFSVNDSEFHLFPPHWLMLRIQLLVSNGQSARRRLKRVSLLLVLASRQRWLAVVNGGCCVALCSAP